MTSLPSPFLLTSFCLRHLLTWSATQDEQVVTCIALRNIRCLFLCPFFPVTMCRVICCCFWVNIYPLAKLTSKDTPLKYSFSHSKDIWWPLPAVFLHQTGDLGSALLLTCSKFCALVYRVYVIFDAELYTTSWAPVLTNRQFKECMFTYM